MSGSLKAMVYIPSAQAEVIKTVSESLGVPVARVIRAIVSKWVIENLKALSEDADKALAPLRFYLG